MDIKLICDSLCDIPDELYEKEYLEVVPLTLILDGKEYRDNIDLTKEEFYERALKSDQVPKTSQATYVQFKEAFDKAMEEGKRVICITGASTKSGTYQSAVLAKNDTDGPIHVFDTEQLSLGAGQYIVRACDMIDEGLSYDDVLSGLETVRDTVSILFAPSSFDFLKKSGRVNLSTAILGNMLSIKPIFIMEKGEISLAAKVRGVKKLVTKLVDMVLEKNEKYLSEITVIVGYGSNLENLAKFKEEIENKVTELAKQIEKDYEGQDLLLVGILKGASVFVADLMRKINLNVNIDFMSVSSYGSGTVSSGTVKILKDLDVDIKDKNVLIVEDIIDSGITLRNLYDTLMTREPRSLKLCTLLNKPARKKVDVNVDYVGFVIEDKFIVGYGIDYDEKYRNLPYIAIVEDVED